MPNCSRSHFSATAPAATRPIVSRAEERPDPTRRAQHSLRQTRRASLTERSQENAAENSKRIALAPAVAVRRVRVRVPFACVHGRTTLNDTRAHSPAARAAPLRAVGAPPPLAARMPYLTW